MNKYSDRPDYELNLAVARHLGHKPSLEHGVVKIKKELRHGVVIYSDNFDPCNDPADAMPIIIENGIGMNYIDKDIGWCAYHFDEEKGELEIYDKNYYRAAMICFLIMKDEE